MPISFSNMGGSAGEGEEGAPAVMGVPPIILMVIFLVGGWYLFRIATKRG